MNIIFFFVFIIFLLVFGLLSFYFYPLYSDSFNTVIQSSDPAKWGAMGDLIGGILNPILAFMSLLLLLISIHQQKKSLEQTSKQISISLDEVTKSVAAQEKQAEINEKQLDEVRDKANLDDSIRIVSALIDDISSILDSNLTCFRDQGESRKLRSQILDMKSFDENNEQVELDFKNVHSYQLAQIRTIFSYIDDALLHLKNADKNSVLFNYYDNKVSELRDIAVI